MRRPTAASLGVALLLVAAVHAIGPGGAAPAAAGPDPWTGEPTLLGGTARYDAGEWIYTDFVFDDYGADTGSWGQPNVVSLAPTAGDARYPAGDAYRGNAADIVEIRARLAGTAGLEVRAVLQTIVDPDVVAVWVRADDTEQVITTATPGAAIDAGANTVTFTVPGVAGDGTVALTVGAGLHDGSGGLRAGVAGSSYTDRHEITTGGPTGNRLFDLAFNTREIEGRGGAWNEDLQSRALAAGGDALAPFAQTIDVAALAAATTTPPPSGPGYYVRLFESRQDLPEGMAGARYGGRWQPYAVWVPDGYDPGASNPLVLNLHSLSVHHNQYRGGRNSTYTTYYEQVGDHLDAVVVTPLARGPSGWYEDEALVDTLEAWADASDRYAIDPDRTLVTGYSMGGYGTYRLATLLPDSFASAASIVGPPGPGVWLYPAPPPGGEGSPHWTYPQLESTRHVPFWITHGVLDELVPFSGVARQAGRFAELGHEHRFAAHPGEDHLSFAVKDDWSREAAWFAAHLTRATDPHRVTLDIRPASWATGGDPVILGHLRALTSEIGARLDGGYWVRDVVVDGPGDVTGVVDLASDGITRREAGTVDVAMPGVDGPSPHALTGIDVAWADGVVADVLRGTLTNVSSLTVDVGRARLSDSPGLDVTADRPVTITFVRAGAVVGSATVG